MTSTKPKTTCIDDQAPALLNTPHRGWVMGVQVDRRLVGFGLDSAPDPLIEWCG